MVPAAFAGQTVAELADRMSSGDVIIDGGNTYYRDDIDRAKQLQPKQLHYVDYTVVALIIMIVAVTVHMLSVYSPSKRQR